MPLTQEVTIDLLNSPLDEAWFVAPITLKIDLVDENLRRRPMTDASTLEVIEVRDQFHTITNGNLSVDLWPNARGVLTSLYRFAFSNSGGPIASFYFKLEDQSSIETEDVDILYPIVVKPWHHHFIFPLEVLITAGHWSYESGNTIVFESGNPVDQET